MADKLTIPSTPYYTHITTKPSFLQSLELKAIWKYRELLGFLIWRDMFVQYRLMALGVLWAVVNPFMTTFIYTIIFGTLLKVGTEGDAPYALFSMSALIPWNYFSGALGNVNNILVANQNLLKKIYFPRLLLPLAALCAPLLNMGITFVLLLVMMVATGVPLSPLRLLTLPLFLLVAMFSALGLGLITSVWNVKYRDVGMVLGLFTRFWMYATPIIYAITVIPPEILPIYYLNPLVGVVQGFRWALLDASPPDISLMLISLIPITILTIWGLYAFHKAQGEFADHL